MPKRISDKARYRQRKRYYLKHEAGATMKGKPWDIHEDVMVLDRKTSDVELSRELGRSVRAIQIKRCRLLKKDRPSADQKTAMK